METLKVQRIKKISLGMLDYLWRNTGYSQEKALFNIAYLLAYKYADKNRRIPDAYSWQSVLESKNEYIVEMLNSEIGHVIDFLNNIDIKLTLKSIHVLHIMQFIEELDGYLGDEISYGDAFNILLGSTNLEERNNTQGPVTEIIIKLLANMSIPTNGRIGNANCGHGQFLVGMLKMLEISPNYRIQQYSHIEENISVQGFDIATENIAITTFQLFFNDFPTRNLKQENFLSVKEEKKFSLLVITPPFGSGYVKSNQGLLPLDIVKTVAQEVSYLLKAIEVVMKGGTGVIVLPEGFFSSSSYRDIRKWLLNTVVVEGIVSLPRGLYKKSGIKISVLIFRKPTYLSKDPLNKYVWFYEIDKSDLEYNDLGIPILNDSKDLKNSWEAKHSDFLKWKSYLDNNNEKFSNYPLSDKNNQKVTFATYNQIKDQEYN